jgi:tetratricopeptide (TPR) repeat protein
MNFRGNYILAEALFQQVVKILPDWVHRAQSEPELLTQEECARRLAFTGYDRYRVAAELLKRFGRAPFSNQIYHEEQIRQEKQNLNGLEIYTYPKALMEAASQYQAAIQNADTDPWLHYNYAQLLQASQNLQPASDELRFFLRYFPQHAPSYEKLAKILIIQGKFEEAITQCKKALRLKPQFASVLYHMAFALAKQGKFDQGIEKYQKLIDLDPQKSIDIYNQIGKIQAHQGKFEEAAETFRRAIEFNADSEFNKAIPDVHFNLGYVLKRLGKPDEATRELQKAIQGYRSELNENPNLAETHTVLGKALVEIGNYKDATEHYQQAIDLDPTNLTKHMNLIRVLEIQGRFDEAIEASRQAAGVMLNHGQKEAAAKLQRHLKTLESRK